MSRSNQIPYHLEKMCDAIDKARSYAEELSQNEFIKSRLVQDAVIRNLSVVGKAATFILQADPNFASRHSEMPLGRMIAMRHSLIEAYFDVDLSEVWEAVQRDLPLLYAQAVVALQDARAE